MLLLMSVSFARISALTGTDDSLTRKQRKRLVSASCALAKDSEIASDLKIQAVNRACVLPPTRKSTSREHAVPKLVWDGHITIHKQHYFKKKKVSLGTS